MSNGSRLPVHLLIRAKSLSIAAAILIAVITARVHACEWLQTDFDQFNALDCNALIALEIEHGAKLLSSTTKQKPVSRIDHVLNGNWHGQTATLFYSCQGKQLLFASCTIQSTDREAMIAINSAQGASIEKRWGPATHSFVPATEITQDNNQYGWESSDHIAIIGTRHNRRSFFYTAVLIRKDQLSESDSQYYQQHRIQDIHP